MDQVSNSGQAGLLPTQQQPQQQPQPGPCPPLGCPPTTEVACIETTYIYDSCFLPVRRELTGAIPGLATGFDPAAAFIASCTVQSTACGEVGRTPAGDPGSGLFNVTLRFQYDVQVEVIQNGTTFYQGTLSDVFFRTIKLCAPEGTTVDCASYSTVNCQAFVASFGEIPAEANVQVNVSICLVTRSFAVVQLLVPSYGFCVPAEYCEEPDVPPCPPDLFPAPCCGAPNNGG